VELIEHSEGSDRLYVYPLGDLHVGDKAFGKFGLRKFLGYRDHILSVPNAYAFLMGDIFNCASRTSKTSPFESRTEEYDEGTELFRPLAEAGRIIGAIEGNHERRMRDAFGYSLMKSFCEKLKIPYCGLSAIVRFRVGQRPKRSNVYWQVYHGFFHHGNAGGGSIGNALNAKVKLRQIVEGMDFYASGHDHQMLTGQQLVFTAGKTGVIPKKITYIDTGGFLDYNGSYAEAAGMSPTKLGAPRIRLGGERGKHDVHVSL
jgi:hypothetical protein